MATVRQRGCWADPFRFYMSPVGSYIWALAVVSNHRDAQDLSGFLECLADKPAAGVIVGGTFEGTHLYCPSLRFGAKSRLWNLACPVG